MSGGFACTFCAVKAEVTKIYMNSYKYIDRLDKIN